MCMFYLCIDYFYLVTRLSMIDIYLMFCLQEPDLIPLGDIAVVNTIKELLDIHDKNEMEIHAEQWSPYRSYATYLLWHYYLNKRNRKITY